MTAEQEKYYEKGCIVDSIIDKNESLINLLELFIKYPDPKVDIYGYINYCEMQYDYEQVLRSSFFSMHKDLGEALAEQILCSILRRDENYHYENISFIEENGKIKSIAPMIDMEFSEMFMHPDEIEKHKQRFTMYDIGMGPLFRYDKDKDLNDNYFELLNEFSEGSIYEKDDINKFYLIKNNLRVIAELYPGMCELFIQKLLMMREEVAKTNIEFSDSYLGVFSSSDWKPTRLIIKEGKSRESTEYIEALNESERNKIVLNQEEFNERLKKEVLWSIDKLIYMLNFYLNIESDIIETIEDYNNKVLYSSIVKTKTEKVYKKY